LDVDWVVFCTIVLRLVSVLVTVSTRDVVTVVDCFSVTVVVEIEVEVVIEVVVIGIPVDVRV
jgi:hypothetical protein